jgi:hypothetical protein
MKLSSDTKVFLVDVVAVLFVLTIIVLFSIFSEDLIKRGAFNETTVGRGFEQPKK